MSCISCDVLTLIDELWKVLLGKKINQLSIKKFYFWPVLGNQVIANVPNRNYGPCFLWICPTKCFWHFNKDQIISQWWPEQCSFLSLIDCGRAKVFTYIYDFTTGESWGSHIIILKWWQTVSYPIFPTVQVSLHKVFNPMAHDQKKKYGLPHLFL